MTSGHESTASLVTGGGKPPGAPRFGAGDLLAGRYKVVRFIAEGGMGEVYEAEDLALGERVALKTVRPDVAADGKAIERFKREIQLARKVTHHNVCRIFDLAFHKDSDREITFLTMELLAGQTLASRLRERGPIPLDEARPLVEQMAAALAAAHDAGVIHRDFKSANVVLVGGEMPAPSTASQSGQHARAVVTDFGLARAAAGGDAGITGAGGIVGSPAYMAPEQVEGGQIGAATDIYALGVVMYEMVTGEVPFRGDTPLATAVSRLKDPAPSPRKHNPELPRAWERAILRCLSRRPQDRFASVRDVVSALDDGSSRGTRTTGMRPAATQPVWMKPVVYAGAAALVGLALVAWFMKAPYSKEKERPPSSPASKGAAVPEAAPVKRTLAVMGFKDLSGAPASAWMSGALIELFATELAAGEGARIVPAESVSRTRRSLQLAETEMYAADTLAKLRKALDADYVIVGTYLSNGGSIRLDLRVQDTKSGETVASVTENGSENELVPLVVRSSARLRAALGFSAPTPEAAAAAVAALPANTDAARLYAEGVKQYRSFECQKARDLLERAVAADPKHARARSVLGEVLYCLGFEAQGAQEATRAVELAAKLPSTERAEIEAISYHVLGRHHEAAEVYRGVYETDPNNIDAGIHFAGLLMKKNDDEHARAVLRKLQELAGPDDVRVINLEVEMHLGRNKLTEALAAVQRGEALARGRGERAALAMFLFAKASIYINKGQFALGIAAARESNEESKAVGDRDGVCLGSLKIAAAQKEMGDLAAAKATALEVVAMARELGARRRERHALDILADIAFRKGDLAECERILRELIDVSREEGAEHWRARSLLRIGNSRMVRGDLPGARKEWLAGKEAFGMYADEPSVKPTLGLLDAEGLLLEGDIAGARARMKQVYDPKSEAVDFFAIWFGAMVAAEIALHDGRPTEAEDAIRQLHKVVDEEQRHNLPEFGFAELALARALMDQGKLEDAQAILDRVTKLADKSGMVMLRLDSQIVSGRLQALSKSGGELKETRKLLEKALSEATRFGFVLQEFEARLELGRLVGRTNAEDGRQRLMQLQRDAKAKGLGLYVQKAASRT